MRNDQIFVLLLVILLPMSGCFDGAVGDAEGTDDEPSSGTTVVNNYYNNTTVISTPTTQVLYINQNTSAQLSISPGQLIEVLDVWTASIYSHAESVTPVYDDRTLAANFSCSTHTEMQRIGSIGISGNDGDYASEWLPSDGTSCTYYFDRTSPPGANPYMGDAYVIYWIH